MRCPEGFERSQAPGRLPSFRRTVLRVLRSARLGEQLPDYSDIGVRVEAVLVTPQFCKRPVAPEMSLGEARGRFGVSLEYGELVKAPGLYLIDVDVDGHDEWRGLVERALEALGPVAWSPTRRGIHVYAVGEPGLGHSVARSGPVRVEVIDCSRRFCASPLRTLDHIVWPREAGVNPYAAVTPGGLEARPAVLPELGEALALVQRLTGTSVQVPGAPGRQPGAAAGPREWLGYVTLGELLEKANELPPCARRLLRPETDITGSRFARIALLLAALSVKGLCLRARPEELCETLGSIHGWSRRDVKSCVYKVRSLADKARLGEGLLCYRYGYEFPASLAQLIPECGSCRLSAKPRPYCLAEAIARTLPRLGVDAAGLLAEVAEA